MFVDATGVVKSKYIFYWAGKIFMQVYYISINYTNQKKFVNNTELRVSRIHNGVYFCTCVTRKLSYM